MAAAEELRSVLARYGYKGPVPSPPAGNKRIEKFLKLVTDELNSCENLTGDAKRRFDEMRRLSKELSKEDFRKVLEKREAERLKSNDKNELAAAELEEEASLLREQLQTVNHMHKQLSNQHVKSIDEKEKVTNSVTELQSDYERMLQQCHDANSQINKSLNDLQTAVNQLSDLYSNQTTPINDREDVSCPSQFLSTLSQSQYHEAEEEFMKSLSSYAKKQFLPGMAQMANLTDTVNYGLLDDSQLVHHLSEEDYQLQSQKLKRLQTNFPVVMRQSIDHEVTKAHSTAVAERLREEIELAKTGQGLINTDIDTLREQILTKQKHLDELKAQIQSFNQSLPQLIQQWASLKTSHVLHGDHDLKLERQQYYSSKQDEIVDRLKDQRGRQELLSMLLEVEFRYHRDTHRLLLAAASQLQKWKNETAKRQKQLSDVISDQSLSPSPAADATKSLCRLLKVDSTQTTQAAQKELKEKISEAVCTKDSVEAQWKASDGKVTGLVSEMEQKLLELEEHLFGKGEKETRIVQFMSKELEESVDKLQQMLSHLESDIKAILKEYEEKRKALQSSPFLEEERNLFVYFFTDTSKLSAVMATLTQRVNTLAAAVGLTKSDNQ